MGGAIGVKTETDNVLGAGTSAVSGNILKVVFGAHFGVFERRVDQRIRRGRMTHVHPLAGHLEISLPRNGHCDRLAGRC